MTFSLPPEAVNRFWSKVDTEGICWDWTGWRNPKGYGRYTVGSGSNKWTGYVHRAAYELLVGEIPEGKEIDHLCYNRRCVNPDHMEIVEPIENKRRARIGLRGRKKDKCKRGHLLTEENRYVQILQGGKESSSCLTCRRERNRVRFA